MHGRCDSLPSLCQAVQTRFHILLVELNLFVVHLGFLVQSVDGKLQPVQFLLALLAVAVLVADVLQTHNQQVRTVHTAHTHSKKYTRTRTHTQIHRHTDTHARTHAHTHTHRHTDTHARTHTHTGRLKREGK